MTGTARVTLASQAGPCMADRLSLNFPRLSFPQTGVNRSRDLLKVRGSWKIRAGVACTLEMTWGGCRRANPVLTRPDWQSLRVLSHRAPCR